MKNNMKLSCLVKKSTLKLFKEHTVIQKFGISNICSVLMLIKAAFIWLKIQKNRNTVKCHFNLK